MDNFFAIKKLKAKSKRVVPPTFKVSDNKISPTTTPYFMTSLEDLRYNSIDDSLWLLSQYDPDVSNAVQALMANVNTSWYPVVYTPEGEIDLKGYKKLITLINNWNYYYNISTWDRQHTLDSIINGMVKTAMVRGGVCAELELDGSRTPINLHIIDPKRIYFKQLKPNIFTPFVESEDKEIALDYPTFFYEPLIPQPDDPYVYSPIVAVLEVIFFSLSVIRDLQGFMKRAGTPKFDVKVLYDTLMKAAPASVRIDPVALQKFVNDKFTEIDTALREANPEDALIHLDYVEVSLLESTNGTASNVDFRPIIEILDQKVSAALKTLPTILGRTIGSSGASKEEIVLYTKIIKMYQKHIATTLSKIFTVILRLNGSKSFVKFKFEPVSLRSDQEVENHLMMKQKRLIEAVSLKWMTDDEAAFEMYGRPAKEESGVYGMYMVINGNKGVTQDPLGLGDDPSSSGTEKTKDSTVDNEEVVARGQEPSATGEVNNET